MRDSKTVATWRNADAVCFDVDSTVLTQEGIDELARYCGKLKEVQKLTASAMGGKMTFREALEKRLSIMNPGRDVIKKFLKTHPLPLTPGVKELIAILHSRNVAVYLISGGFYSFIYPLAKEFNIPRENVFANRLLFDIEGHYAGFDHLQPTSDSGGKGLVIEALKRKFGYQKLVMIGDGATDMEACPPADAFIGFGGNIVRPAVKQGAGWFASDFNELMNELKPTDDDDTSR